MLNVETKATCVIKQGGLITRHFLRASSVERIHIRFLIKEKLLRPRMRRGCHVLSA